MLNTNRGTQPMTSAPRQHRNRNRNRSRRVTNAIATAVEPITTAVEPITTVVEPITTGVEPIAITQTRKNRNRNRNRNRTYTLVEEPDIVEPAIVEPAIVEPAIVEPAIVEPAIVEPAIVEPTTIRPISLELKQSMYRQLNPTTRQTNLLKTLCPESGDCVILGKHIDLLKEYFNNFKSNIKSIKMIGAPSANGFINEITYSKNNYEAYCILKSSQNDESDNLYYEWYIGKFFINHFVPKFPCFVETYSLGIYETPYYYNLFKQNRNSMQIPRGILDKDDFSFKTNIKKDDSSLANVSCDSPTDFCVLIQHMKNPISFDDFISRNKATEYGFNVDILQIFLQIFIPLGVLSDSFTHNDLHTNNVLLYTIPNNKYIVLNYHIRENMVVKIKTRYIAKIIDYGRAYFRGSSRLSSAYFFNNILTEPVCKTHKDANGYTWFEPANNNSYYISQTEGNVSKDLWLPGIYWSTPGKYRGPQQLTGDIRQLFGRIIGVDSEYISIPPTKTCQTNSICNVRIFAQELIKIYLKNNAYITQKYDEVLTGGSIGELDIFASNENQDSVFTASTSMSGGRKVKRKTKKRV